MKHPLVLTRYLSTVGVLLLALAATAARWFTRAHRVYAWDSVHYMLAQDRYDILAHQPHPPGSLFYVLLARLARLITHDPHQALLLLSALGGGAMVLVLFQLGRELGGERAGWLAAIIGATAPFFWFFGSVGLNYGPTGTLCALFSLACLRACRDKARNANLLLASVTLGVLGGFRPTDVIFLLPAYVWTLYLAWRGRPEDQPGPYRAVIAGNVAVMLAVTLAWLVPNCISCHGLANYLRSIQGQEHLIQNTSVFLAGWRAWGEAVLYHRRSLQSALGVAWIPAVAWTVWSLGRRGVGIWKTSGGTGRPFWRAMLTAARPAFQSPSGTLFILIVEPAFLFYLLVHFNSPGYAFTYAPLLAALGGAAAARLCDEMRPSGAWRVAALAAAIAAGNTGLYLLGWPGVGSRGQWALSGAEIRDHDRYYDELNAFLESRYRPGQMRLLSSCTFTDGLRLLETELPKYQDDVAQAVDPLPDLPPSFAKLRWLRLRTPQQLFREGRPLLAVSRTRDDLPYYMQLFSRHITRVYLGPGHYLLYIRPWFSIPRDRPSGNQAVSSRPS